MAARDVERGRVAAERVRGKVDVVRLDLADLGSVRAFAAELAGRGSAVDVLVNNAGIGMPPHSVTALGIESQFAVNHLGHFALTGLLLPLLRRGAGSRVVTVSSEAYRHGSIDFSDLSGERAYRGPRFYRQSKFANVVFGLELDRRLRAAGIPVASVLAHPGFASTNLPSSSGGGVVGFVVKVGNSLVAQSAERGARSQLLAACAPGVEGGQFYGPGGFAGMWGPPVLLETGAAARDPETARRLWDVSAELTGVAYDFT
jgi:NAD(P)-dependent dehydrogenase (short-subunit alcohol dehydrogenase family)